MRFYINESKVHAENVLIRGEEKHTEVVSHARKDQAGTHTQDPDLSMWLFHQFLLYRQNALEKILSSQIADGYEAQCRTCSPSLQTGPANLSITCQLSNADSAPKVGDANLDEQSAVIENSYLLTPIWLDAMKAEKLSNECVLVSLHVKMVCCKHTQKYLIHQ